MTEAKWKSLQQKYLLKLYELSDGNLITYVSMEQIENDLGISNEDATSVMMNLQAKQLAEFAVFGKVKIEPRGIEVVEEAKNKLYAEKEYLVLKTIYDFGAPGHTRFFIIDDVVRQLQMDYREVSNIITDLDERKHLVESREHDVRILPAGIEAIESTKKEPPPHTINYNMNIGENYGNAGQGSGFNQSITITNNPEFDQAIAGLIQLIQSSTLPNHEIEELQEEVIKLNRLALAQPKPGLLEKAKARIDVVRGGLQGTIAIVRGLQYLDVVWKILKVKLKIS
jgi:Mn-dependent DtxR family transcriptional regulator